MICFAIQKNPIGDVIREHRSPAKEVTALAVVSFTFV